MSLNPPASFWQAAAALADGLHAPRNASILKVLAAWSYCEKPHTGAGAWEWNNPLNTTEPGFGSTGSVNSAGVKIYPSPAQGVAATVTTMTNGFYPAIVAALRAGNGAGVLGQVGEMATWGTDLACVRTTYSALANPPAQYRATVQTVSAPGPNSSGLVVSTTPPAGALTPATVVGLGLGAAALAGAGVLAWPWLREQAARTGRGRILNP